MDENIKAALTDTHIDILKREKRIRRLRQLIHTTLIERDNNKRCYQSWQDACANFHQSYKLAALVMVSLKAKLDF